VLNHYESTDNAYVQGNVVQLTPQVAGTVVAIAADDTDFVKAGQTLVRSTRPMRASRSSRPRRSSRQAVRQSRTLFVNNGALRAQIAAREADLARAQSDLARAEEDVARRAPLVASGAVGKEEFNHVTAQSRSRRPRSRRRVGHAGGARAARLEPVAHRRPLGRAASAVLQAAAKVREAHLALARAELSRRSTATSRGAASSSASGSRPARRCSR
jgi:membrane fusion protein (multidrug efflux system)